MCCSLTSVLSIYLCLAHYLSKKEIIQKTVVAKQRLLVSLNFSDEILLDLYKCSLLFLSLR